MTRDVRGMTLIEVAVAMGLLSAVILAIASISVHSSRAARSDELSGDWSAVSAAVGKLLRTPAACTTALQGKPLDLTRFPISLDHLSLLGGDIARVGAPAVGMQIAAIEIDRVLQMDVEVNGFLHKHLVNLRLRGRKVSASGPLPGANQFEKDFAVAVVQDVASRSIASCF